MSPSPSASDESDGSDDAPNILGGAYDSSGDEADIPAPGKGAAAATLATGLASHARNGKAAAITLPLVVGVGAVTLRARMSETVEAAARQGDGFEAPLSPPTEAKRLVVQKMVGFVSRNGQAFEDRVRER